MKWQPVMAAITTGLLVIACAGAEEAEVSAPESGAESGDETSSTEAAEDEEVEGDSETVEIADGWITEVDESLEGELRIAHGFGATYGVPVAVRELGAIEAKYPNVETTWFDIGETGRQRDSMLPGELHFGTCTAPPFLASWDAGVEWRVLKVIGAIDIVFYTQEDGPDEMVDLVDTDMNISPGPDTAGYYAAQKYLLDNGLEGSALDQNWISLPHPDAVAALETGQLSVHAATSEFALRYANETDMKQIMSLEEVMGVPLGVCATAMAEWADENPDLARAYHDVLSEGVDWAEANPEPYAVALSDFSDGQVEPSVFQELQESGLAIPTHENFGMQAFADIMTELGLIDREYSGPEDFYVYPDEAPESW